MNVKPEAGGAAASRQSTGIYGPPTTTVTVPELDISEPQSDNETAELHELSSLLSGGNSARRAPPSRAEITVMPVHAAVRTLEQFFDSERVAGAVIDRWKGLSYGPARRQSAAEAGALEAIVRTMKFHASSAELQQIGCLAIGNIVAGIDEEGIARKQRAANCSALEAIVSAMQTHVEAASVLEFGCFAVGNICYAADAAGLARKQRAADACAVSAVIRALRTHADHAAIAEYGSFALGNICRAVGGKEGGTDAHGVERKQAAVDAGALSVLVNALRFHAKVNGVQEWGTRALSNITFGNSEWREMAKAAGSKPQWLVGMAEAMEAIEEQRVNGAGASKTERVAIRAPVPLTRPNTVRAPPVSRAPQPGKRAPRVAPKGNGGVGGMVPLPDAGPLWRDRTRR